MSTFIPSLHFLPANEKLTPKFCDLVIGYYWFNQHLRNLLHGKDIKKVEEYSIGEYDLAPFKRIYRSLRKQSQMQGHPNIQKDTINNLDRTGIQWTCVPLIPPKLNSAIATAQKIPIEITATCQDPLAQKKKKEDLEYLRNKADMESAIQPLYDSMNLGRVELGPTKHSSIPFTGMPMDLDVDDEDEFRIFADLIYNLAPESAFETVLQQFYDFKKVNQIKLLEITDQYKWAISVHQALMDKNTDLPNIEYTHPGDMTTDRSLLPDFSDNIIRIKHLSVTPMELFKYFPNEICDEESLEKIVNFGGGKGAWGCGYTFCNDMARQDRGNWDNFRMNLKYVEIKSVDSAMIAQKKKSKYRYFTEDEKLCTDKVWAQNTYCFYWLQNTKWFFGIDKLGFAYRSKGNETYTNFTTNIYRSQYKSAVELSIGENEKAQIADIKLQHAIIMSAPAGKVIDIKYIRNAIEGLTEDMDQYSEKDLIDIALEQNIHIIDTEGFENKQVGQFLPVKDLPGGLKDDIIGYYRVIAEATQRIAMYTGINEQLTGQSANPEGLVGLQKLLVNASINSINYVNEAIIAQYQSLFNTWGYYIQQAIKKGGAGKQAIVNLIGDRKVDIIKGLDEVPLHRIGIKIKLGMREEEKQQVKFNVQQMRGAGILNAADEYFILNVSNPKDAAWLIAVKENKFRKQQEVRQQQLMASQQQIAQQQGQNMLQNTQAQTDGKIQQISAQGEVEAKLMQLGAQLGLSSDQMNGLIKRALQEDRMKGQIDKSLKTIAANKNFDAQKAF